jgi:hypothetical protein
MVLRKIPVGPGMGQNPTNDNQKPETVFGRRRYLSFRNLNCTGPIRRKHRCCLRTVTCHLCAVNGRISKQLLDLIDDSSESAHYDARRMLNGKPVNLRASHRWSARHLKEPPSRRACSPGAIGLRRTSGSDADSAYPRSSTDHMRESCGPTFQTIARRYHQAAAAAETDGNSTPGRASSTAFVDPRNRRTSSSRSRLPAR